MGLRKKISNLCLFSILLILFSSCSEKEEQKGNVIEQGKFIEILVDVHIADAILTMDLERNNPDLFVPENFYLQVLKNHNIIREDFDRSIEYYSDDPARLEIIYKAVSEKLSIKEAEVVGVKTQNELGETIENPDSIPQIQQ